MDPFYLNLLEKAEKSFLAKDYKGAARNFEVAAFGLIGNNTLLAKAKVYLGLCRYYLDDLAGSEKSLREAADLVGEEGFASLEIYESTRPDLEKLISFFNLPPLKSQTPSADVENPILAKTETQGSHPVEPPKKPEEVESKDKGKQTEIETATRVPTKVNIEALKEGDLVPLDLVETRPELVKSIPAVYPAYARPLRIEGTVIIKALISEKGNVIETEIIQGIQNAVGFDQAARTAVRQWRFEPATVKGIKVKVWIQVAVEFKRSQSPQG